MVIQVTFNANICSIKRFYNPCTFVNTLTMSNGDSMKVFVMPAGESDDEVDMPVRGRR